MPGRTGKRCALGASSPALRVACAFLSLVFVWQVCLGVLPAHTAYAEDAAVIVAEEGTASLDDSGTEVAPDEGAGDVEPAVPEGTDDNPDDIAEEAPVEPVDDAIAVDETVEDALTEEERAELIAQAEAEDAAAGAGTAFVEDEVLVVFAADVTDAEATEIVEVADEVEVPEDGIDTNEAVVTVDVAETASVADAVEALEEDPNVVIVQPNFIYYEMEDGLGTFGAADMANDPSVGSQWYLDGANVPAAWELVTCGSAATPVSIAILDSGCNLAHEDLAGNIVAYHDASADAYPDNATGMNDISNHGTHVAGIASAVTDNGVGIAGVSYNAGLVPIQVFYYNTSGRAVANSSTLVAAYNWMIENRSTYNIRVANLSLGSPGHLTKDGSPTSSDCLLADAIDRADGAGILTVCAAGNATSTSPVPYNSYPGDYDTCLSVMNIQSNDTLSNASNYNTSDVTEGSANYTKDICAPGASIYSTTGDGAYGQKSGTSMAAPVVSGIAALLFTVNPELTPAEARTILESTAVDLGDAGWDQMYGYGKVDAAAAVEAAGAYEPPDMTVHATVEVTAVDTESGTYTVTVSDINCPAGVKKIQMPSWVKNDQSDIKWYTATDNGDGTYSYTVPMSDHAWTEGAYRTHVYITDGDGTMTCVGGVKQDMIVPPTAIIAVTLNPSHTTATVMIAAPRATAVRLPVWSSDKGQDDLVWYTATKQSNGAWKVTIPLSAHKSTGTFIAHCYVTVNGQQALAASRTFSVAPPTAAVQVTSVDEEKGTYTVTVSGITCPQGIAKVQMPTWVKNDQSDIKWYTATKKSDGTYSFTVPMSDHAWTAGTYRTHVYVTDGNGAMTCVGGVTQSMQVPQATITTTLNASQTTATISIVAPQATAVRVPVWSVNKGQDDLVWYTASKQSDGTWKVTVPVSKHKSTGTFNVHCYATIGGTQSFVGNTTFVVDAPTATVEIVDVDTARGTYTVRVSNISCASGVKKVQMPTWVKSDQSDIKWYVLTKGSDNSFTYTVPMSDHAWTGGTYRTHVYITDGNGTMTCVGGVTQPMTTPQTSVIATLSSDEKTAALTAVTTSNATAVSFAVWSDNGGQDDIVWYKATKQSDGTWTASVPISKHHDAGRYEVHCYGTIGGKQTFIEKSNFTVTAPTAMLTVTPNANNSTMTVSVAAINSPSGVSQMRVPTWSVEGGQDDIIWHSLSGNAAQGYSTTIDVGTHYYNEGTYLFHCYLTAGNGVTVIADTERVDLTPQLRGVVHVISDTQLLSYDCMESAHLTDTLADIQRSGGTNGIVINGDVTENSQQSEYNFFKGIVDKSGFSLSDFSFGMGNHEMRVDYAGESYGVLWTRFRNNFNLPANYYTKEIDGQRFIFCGCDEAPQSTWVASRFSTTQINWLEEQLATNEAEGYTSYVCIHHPIINTVNGSYTGQWGVNWGSGLENGAVVKNTLDRHANVIVFTSHTHYDLRVSNVYRQNASKPLYVNTASIAYTNNDDDWNTITAQGWYLFIFDDRVELRGRDFLRDSWVNGATYTFSF